jgi:ATP:corrinoid adenosyltransferase
MACGWISVEDVAEVLQARPGFQQFGIDDVNVDGPVALSAALPTKNLICISSSAATLRRSPVAVTDLVTEMRKVKHPFDAGIPAQRAIE